MKKEKLNKLAEAVFKGCEKLFGQKLSDEEKARILKIATGEIPMELDGNTRANAAESHETRLGNENGSCAMKEQMLNLFTAAIQTWTEEDIYAISLFVYDEDDDPCTPTVTLGYNTEAQYQDSIESAYDEQEARWNYAFWLQNAEVCFGVDDTAETVKAWLRENEFPCNSEDEDDEKLELITKAFVDVLIQVVRELHESRVITEKFGKPIPILIHELEYYDAIAEQNIKANGSLLVKDFVAFCTQF